MSQMSRSTSLRLTVAFGLALALALAACAAPPQAAPSPAQPFAEEAKPAEATAPAPGQPKPGGTLRVGTNQDAVGFDPHLTNATASYRILENIYSSLLRFKPNLEIEGDLAESYRAIDPTTWEFKLRKGVKFHSGKPLTSADVKYSLERIKDPEVKSPRSSQLAPIVAIETPDDYTVIIKTEKPFAPLLAVLADRTIAIVNKDFVEANGGKLDNVADGTGPFKLKEWVPNTRTVLEKNPDYFIPGQPLLDQVIYQPIPDDTARSTAVRTGTVDFIEYAPPKDLELLRSDGNIVITGEGNNNVRFLAFNTTVKPFDNPKVRQAIAWAVDREAVLQAAVNGAGTPLYAGPFLPSFWPGLQEPVYKRDLEKAKQLLAEAGYPDGFTAKLKNTPTYSFLGNAGIAVQEQLKEIGINLEIESLEWSVFLKDYLGKNFEAVVSGYSGFADPHTPLDGTYVTGRQNNFMSYSNPKFDELVAQGAQETDQAKRAEIYREAQRILLEDSPMVFLYAANEYEAMQSYVKGYVHYLNGSHVSFRQVWLDK
ncbi:MAG: diguanylate phosphodiesterase [Candidatus Roseilinea sp.]|nr:MAG: diguanylate phosphodiesterase [Candidatus Roseilinea sp.]GIV84695.1 MAG: diguanylate phosphodiesterase [Candidatus Roseilinea sp.]